MQESWWGDMSLAMTFQAINIDNKYLTIAETIRNSYASSYGRFRMDSGSKLNLGWPLIFTENKKLLAEYILQL
jgi:hypothetical protein